MIGLIFQRIDEVVEVRIDNKNLTFRDTKTYTWVTFENLHLDKSGVIKEFPDLADKENWRAEAIRRFKDKINSMSNEDEIKDYVVLELEKFGWVLRYYQKPGFRPVRVK